MIIIGLSIGEHCSCSIYVKDKIVFASYEERFMKKKCYSGFPYKSLKYGIKKYNIKTKDIKAISVINTTTSGMEFSVVQRFNSFSVEDYIKEAENYYFPILYQKKKTKILKIFKHKINKKTYSEKVLNKIIKEGENIKNSQNIRRELIFDFFKTKSIPIFFVDHHFSHAVYGYIAQKKNYSSSLVFTADSMGDKNENSTVYFVKNGSFKKLFSSGRQNLGKLFRNITLILGLKPYQHEYKVMGLAPYSPDLYNKKIVNELENYMYDFNKDWKFKKKPKDHYFLFKKILTKYRFDSIAGGLQTYFEKMLLKWFDFYLRKNSKKIQNLIFSGGLSMNVKANLKINNLCSKYKKNFFVAPSADDYSHCIGSIFSYKSIFLKEKLKSNQLSNLDLGYEFSDNDEAKTIKWAKKNRWKIVKFSPEKISKVLKDGKILALCHGNAEFGARALGFRSIIANPSNPDTIRIINTKIKSRDFWMPFAPAILSGKEKEYLECKEPNNALFMSCCYKSLKKNQNKILASLHPYDFTARPQIVKKDMNKMFYTIIKKFGDLTGTYALLNTSLNLHGNPIVNDSIDLINLLKKSRIDGCIMKKFIILRV